MRKTLVVLVAMMTVGMTIPAFAELQNVKVGGSLRIRANWYSNESIAAFDEEASEDALFVEQRTRVNVGADFTDDVHAFIELDHYSNWGDEFRGLEGNGVLSGVDGLGGSDDEYDFEFPERGVPSISSDGSVQLYQGYIEMKDAWGAPIDIVIGRKEMIHGDEFLVGNNDTSSTFRGLSFDQVAMKYNNESFNVTGFWARVAQDNSVLESSGDADFMGIYGSYTGLENMTIDGFYYFYHGAATAGNGLDESQDIHTFGGRFAGNAAQFDWAANAAYQIGDVGYLGSGADIVEYNAFALQGAAGYTFDVNTQPRIFLNGGYYSGGDADAGGDEEAAFNRLFSDHEYSEFIDGTDLTNFWYVGGGVSAQVTEAIGLTGVVNYFSAVEDYNSSAEDGDLGLEAAIYAKYDYSEDLYFQFGYAHFFAGDAVEDLGAATGALGSTITLGGGGLSSADDLDYVFLETGISF
jgi:hypothetical protein